MTDDQLRVKIVQKLARKKVVCSNKRRVGTVKNWLATSDQGRVEDLIREMIRDPEAPLERYGGSRDNVRLRSMAAAKQYIVDHGRDLPWGLRRDEQDSRHGGQPCCHHRSH